MTAVYRRAGKWFYQGSPYKTCQQNQHFNLESAGNCSIYPDKRHMPLHTGMCLLSSILDYTNAKGDSLMLDKSKVTSRRVIEDTDIADMFGIEMDTEN